MLRIRILIILPEPDQRHVKPKPESNSTVHLIAGEWDEEAVDSAGYFYQDQLTVPVLVLQPEQNHVLLTQGPPISGTANPTEADNMIDWFRIFSNPIYSQTEQGGGGGPKAFIKSIFCCKNGNPLFNV